MFNRHLRGMLSPSSSGLMEAVHSSKTLVTIYVTTQCHNLPAHTPSLSWKLQVSHCMCEICKYIFFAIFSKTAQHIVKGLHKTLPHCILYIRSTSPFRIYEIKTTTDWQKKKAYFYSTVSMLNSSEYVGRKSSIRPKSDIMWKSNANCPIRITSEFHKNCLVRSIKYYTLQKPSQSQWRFFQVQRLKVTLGVFLLNRKSP
jgi:hypothetical protein